MPVGHTVLCLPAPQTLVIPRSPLTAWAELTGSYWAGTTLLLPSQGFSHLEFRGDWGRQMEELRHFELGD